MGFNHPITKIGIIGGGQLGKMMAQVAKKMGFYVTILDPTPGCPAASVSDEQIIGDFYDPQKIEKLVLTSDVTTYDIEHVGVEIFEKLASKGFLIYPLPKILKIIQDKLKQKEFLEKINAPVPKFKKIEDSNFFSIIQEFGFPVVQKTSKGGYDGRGTFVIRNKNDLQNSINPDSYLEEFINLEKELAINVARNRKGEIKSFPVVEMVFDDRANICDMIIAPARIDKEIDAEVKKIGTKIVEALDGVGIFGIEIFLSKEGEVLVNEIAPRPHNSGHYTIEACITSQFEQHIRAITGLPLGATDLLTPAVMVNILGEPGYQGTAVFKGIEEVLSIPGVSLHIYGKKITRPFRKMGHLTIIDKNIEKAIKKAKKIKKIIKVISKEN